MRLDNLTKKRFGRLIVVAQASNKGRHVQWSCLCDCGNESTTSAYCLRSGQTQSCGCLQKERVKEATTKHGMTTSREYCSWQSMKSRCYYPENKSYKHYGGCGVEVCTRWRDSFQDFYDDMGNRPNGTTLDRINTHGNYEPDNCKWSTSKEQNNNKRA